FLGRAEPVMSPPEPDDVVAAAVVVVAEVEVEVEPLAWVPPVLDFLAAPLVFEEDAAPPPGEAVVVEVVLLVVPLVEPVAVQPVAELDAVPPVRPVCPAVPPTVPIRASTLQRAVALLALSKVPLSTTYRATSPRSTAKVSRITPSPSQSRDGRKPAAQSVAP